MKVVLFPENFKLFFHPNDKFVLKLIQLDFKLPSLFSMLAPEIFSLMIGMFQHQVVNSISLLDFELGQFTSKI